MRNSPWDVRSIYERLFRFLTKHAYPMLDVDGGVLEASGFHLYPLFQVRRALAGIPEAIRPIEELVGLVVDPDSRSFTEEELVPHGWPPVDLRALDDDWVQAKGRKAFQGGSGRAREQLVRWQGWSE